MKENHGNPESLFASETLTKPGSLTQTARVYTGKMPVSCKCSAPQLFVQASLTLSQRQQEHQGISTQSNIPTYLVKMKEPPSRGSCMNSSRLLESNEVVTT